MTEPGPGWTAPGGGPDPQPAHADPAAHPASYPAPDPQTAPGYGPPAGWGPPQGYGQPQGYGWGQPGPWGPPPPGVVPLRPLGLGELLDGAVKIVRRYPKPTLGISAIIALATTLLNVALVLSLDNDLTDFTASTGDEVSSDFQTSYNLASIPGALVGYLAGLVLAGALVVVVGKAVLGRPVSLREVWEVVRRRLLALLGLSLLTGLILAVPFAAGVALTAFAGPVGLLLLLPAIPLVVYLWTRLSLAPAALVLEKTSIRAALRRSGVLVRGSWWRVFGVLVLTWVITSFVSGVVTVPVAIVGTIVLANSGDATVLLLATQVAAGLASVVVSPFSAGVRALLYVDQRMRKEGLDVSLRAAADTPVAS